MSSPLKATYRVYYGQYKKDKSIFHLMNQLTDKQFKLGAIEREVLRDCWSKGIRPTYKEFAKFWLKAFSSHKMPNPEWVFLTDRHLGIAYENWKQLCNEKANAAIKVLNKLMKARK